MQISAGLCWLVAALILGGIDMVAGTFYLLMIGLGCLAGAVVYWADLSLAWLPHRCAPWQGALWCGALRPSTRKKMTP